MNIAAIPLDQIDLGDRLRAIDEEYAQLIAASMAEDGQRTPVEVRAPDEAGRYRLIAGGHRVRAAQIAGLTEMQAVVLKVSELDAQRLEIEENLCRHELTELDRSTFLARWKEVYEALNEAAKHGKGRSKSTSRQVGDLSERKIEPLHGGGIGAAAAVRKGDTARHQPVPQDRTRRACPDQRPLGCRPMGPSWTCWRR